MAEHGRLDPDEPAEAGGPAGDPSGTGPRDDRDPVALAAWRRVAAQRGRRAALGAGPGAAEEDGTDRSEPPTIEVPAPGTGSGVTAASGAGDVWTASRPPPGFGTDARASRPIPSRPLPPQPVPPRPTPPDGPFGAPPEHGGRPSAGSLHDTLLALAGRVDDDALSSVRELVAVEDDAGAAELLSGCLLADAVAVSTTERAVLAPWFTATRVDAELLDLLPGDDAARERRRHRFVADAHADADADAPQSAPDGVDGVDGVVRAAGRLPGVVAVAQCWRITPAGASSGPLPHRVLLVTTDPDVDAEHVAHHVAYAARELGAVSVEVLTAGAALPAYHRDALDAATPVLGSAASPATAPPATTFPATTFPATTFPATTPPAGGAGEEVSEADMLLAELPYRSATDASPGLLADVEPEPAEPAAAEPGRVTDAGELDPDEAAARIAALWSTPAPVDQPPAVADGPSVDLPVEEPAALAEEPARDRADEAPGGSADGVVPRGRTSRTSRADPDGPVPAARVNGHHHGLNGVQHDDLGGTAAGGRAVDPPTDPVGWPFVAEDAPAAVDGVVNGWRDDPAPTGPTGPTPIAGAEAARPAADDSMPELSDRERELLARLHAELAAREQASDRPDPFGAGDRATDPAPPTTPLPAPDDRGPGSDGPVNGEGLPPWTADGRED